MQNRTVFRIAVRVLAILGVVSTLVHLSVVIVLFFSDFPGWGDSGLQEGEEVVYRMNRASEPLAPQWFPGGDRIAFSHKGHVYVVDSAGSHLQLVDGGGSELDLAYDPGVSPDGSRIAYSAYERSGWFPLNKSESWEIVTAKPDGSDRHLLTENDTLDLNPVWSPDGSRIAFESHQEQLSVMAADGSGLWTVTSPPEGSSFIYGWPGWSPAWSPDGSRIAFIGKGTGSNMFIYVVGVDGSVLMRFASEATSPAWSPDGHRIVFAKLDGIYTIAPDGSELREIASFPIEEVSRTERVSWSPDGTTLLFRNLVIKADGSEKWILPGLKGQSSWSPDGTRIAVYDGDRPNGIVYTVGPDGLNGRVLVGMDDDGQLAPAQGRPLP